MNRGFETFFARNMYRRVRDCWNRPIGSTPGAYTDLVDRVSDDYNWTFRWAIHRKLFSKRKQCIQYIPSHPVLPVRKYGVMLLAARPESPHECNTLGMHTCA